MDTKHTAPETIKKHCNGNFNVDILAGWEKGISPRRKVGGRLYDHCPPEHLEGKRLENWFWGYKCGKEYRSIYMQKSMHFSGYNKAGENIVIIHKSWSARRGQVLAIMEKKGCGGDVLLYYFDGSELKRTVNCGI